MKEVNITFNTDDPHYHSVVPDSLWPMDYSPWNSPGQNTRVGSLSLPQGICPTQGSNPRCRQILYQLSYQGSPTNTKQRLIRSLLKLQSNEVYTVYKLANVYLWLLCIYLVNSYLASHWGSLGFIAGRHKLRRWIAGNYLKLCFELLIHIWFFSFPLRVEITVRKKKISHSTNPTTQTGSYYCVNRLHPSWSLCKGWFSSANSTIAKEDRSVSYAPLNYSVS